MTKRKICRSLYILITYCRDTSIVPPLHTHNSNSVWYIRRVCNEMIVVWYKVRSSIFWIWSRKRKVAKSDSYLFFICVMCGSTDSKEWKRCGNVFVEIHAWVNFHTFHRVKNQPKLVFFLLNSLNWCLANDMFLHILLMTFTISNFPT